MYRNNKGSLQIDKRKSGSMISRDEFLEIGRDFHLALKSRAEIFRILNHWFGEEEFQKKTSISCFTTIVRS